MMKEVLKQMTKGNIYAKIAVGVVEGIGALVASGILFAALGVDDEKDLAERIDNRNKKEESEETGA